MDIREAAIKLHKDHNGKLAVASKVPLATRRDLRLIHRGWPNHAKTSK